MLELNTNDSNTTGVEDRLFKASEYNRLDSDLLPFAIRSLLLPDVIDPSAGILRLNYDPMNVRLWESQSKSKLILPRGADTTALFDLVEIGDRPVTVDYTGQETVYIEAVGGSDLIGTQRFRCLLRLRRKTQR